MLELRLNLTRSSSGRLTIPPPLVASRTCTIAPPFLSVGFGTITPEEEYFVGLDNFWRLHPSAASGDEQALLQVFEKIIISPGKTFSYIKSSIVWIPFGPDFMSDKT